MKIQRYITGKRAVLLAATGLLSLALVACGGDDDSNGDSNGSSNGGNDSGAIDYGSLSGSVRIDGSSTVFPISEAVAEEFSKVARNVRANVAFSGTGGGFEKFCRGETEISDASRPMKDSERQKCADNGFSDIVELQVAIDALTVVVSPQNDWATCMTTEELNKLYRAGGATRWSDIRPDWPSDAITFYYPGADSGTFDYFNEVIIEGVDKESSHRTDGTSSEDDNLLVRGVEGDKNAVAYFGFAYYEAEKDRLNAVEVDDGSGCVEPSFDNALQGKYTPLSRPLFIYTRESLLRDRPEVLGFVQYYVENMADLATEVGYISLPDDRLDAQKAKVEPFLTQ